MKVAASLIMTITLALSACAPPRSNPVLFEQEVYDWTPIGTPVAKAASIMRSHGFAVLERDGRAEGGEWYLACTRYRISDSAGIETEWRATLSIVEGNVAAIDADVETHERR